MKKCRLSATARSIIARRGGVLAVRAVLAQCETSTRWPNEIRAQVCPELLNVYAHRIRDADVTEASLGDQPVDGRAVHVEQLGDFRHAQPLLVSRPRKRGIQGG